MSAEDWFNGYEYEDELPDEEQRQPVTCKLCGKKNLY